MPMMKINQNPASVGLVAILEKKTTYRQTVKKKGRKIDRITFGLLMMLDL